MWLNRVVYSRIPPERRQSYYKMIHKEVGFLCTAEEGGRLSSSGGAGSVGEEPSGRRKLWPIFSAHTVNIGTPTEGGLSHPSEPHPGKGLLLP